eukprot:jgi/Mesvir1/14804/Mv05443-RA.1
MMAIRRKLPKQFEEPPASAVNHLDEIPRRAERVLRWSDEITRGAARTGFPIAGFLVAHLRLVTRACGGACPVHKRKATLPDYWWHVEYVAGTSALHADEKVKNLEARIKTRLESARKAKKTEAERSAGGHPVQVGLLANARLWECRMRGAPILAHPRPTRPTHRVVPRLLLPNRRSHQAGCAKTPRVRRVDAAKPHSGLRIQSANTV